MGQKFGRAALHPGVDPFANLPRKSIANVWQAFNDIADGFGLGEDEVVEICADLKEDANLSKMAMTEKSEILFKVLDTDKNGLIDALELMSTVAAVSGMRLEEIVEFILNGYDFDGTAALSLDEVTLALKSAAIGLSKISDLDIPTEETIEGLVSLIYMENASGGDSIESRRISIKTITEELCNHPDIKTWYAYYGNPKQVRDDNVIQSASLDFDEFKFEKLRIRREPRESQAMNWDVRLQMEEDGGSGLDRKSLPWAKAADLLLPAAFANAVIPEDCPDESLDIDWVYGYQGEKSRNNVRYNGQGKLVYPVSRYAIVYNFTSHEQKVFSTHTEEITCLAMHPHGTVVATGEAGPNPRVIVWESETMAIQFSDNKMHKDGILHLAFSPDGKRLVSIGNDPFHTMCVFFWEENRTVFTSQVQMGDCLGVCILADNTIVACGDSYIYFWTKSTEGFAKRQGIFSRNANIQALTCVAQVGNVDTVVTGTQSGSLFLWVDCNCSRIVRGHEGTVTCVYAGSYGILSGGVDNRIRLWTHRFEPGAAFDCSSFGPMPGIRSVCMSADGTSILVGTRGASVYEISAIDGSDLRGGPVASGHFEGNVRAISPHPNKLQFATTADDKQVRVVDMVTHTTVKLATFDTTVKSVSYAPSGDHIAVGLGGDAEHSKAGTFVILLERDMTILHEARDSTAEVTCLQYSADGESLAVATAEGVIYLYGVHEDHELIARCLHSKSPIISIDFSVDGEVLRCNNSDNELLFFSADNGSYLSNYNSLRDVQWHTCTCSQQWHTQCMHFVGFPGERIMTTQMASRESVAVMCGTNEGYIRIHPYPATSPTAEYKRVAAHVDSIAGLVYSNDKDFVLSAGASDRCVVQWKRTTYMPGLGLAGAKFSDQPETEEFSLEARTGAEVYGDSMSLQSAAPEGLLNAERYTGEPITIQKKSDADMNIWLQSVVPPSNPVEQKIDIPTVSLKLEYVHGYRCLEMRNNLAYVNEDEIVFCSASIGVVMSRQNKSQKFYQMHTDAISAFAVSREGLYCATGQSGANPFVTVWSTATCTTLAVLPDVQLHSICCLKFSEKGEYLAVVSADENHTISIYNWRHQTVLSKFYGGLAHVFDVCFADDDEALFVCSVKDLMYWERVASKAPRSNRLTLGESGTWQPFLCSRNFNNSVAVGTADGSIYLFKGAMLGQSVKAHRTALTAMDVNKERTQIISGGKDGYVRIWNRDMDCLREVEVAKSITSQNPRVRCVAFSFDGLYAVVGTQGSELFEMPTSLATSQTIRTLLYGHGCRELWGLASHPTKDEFATTGDDATLRIWDAKNFTLLRTIALECASQAVAYSPDGQYIAVGLGSSRQENKKARSTSKSGGYVILSAKNYSVLHQARDSNEAIRTIKFSADSKSLALGSFDSQIYTYKVPDNFSRRATISGVHMAPVVNLDYSVAGDYIMSVDATRRMVFTETSSGVNIPSAAALRDERWATWSSHVGWPIQGLWLSQPRDCAPSTSQRSFNGQLLATGNTGGRVYITHYPCQSQAGFSSAGGHAGPVSKLCWLPGDSSVVSIGQKDYSIFQWKVLYADSKESGDEGGLSCDDSAAENEVGFESRHKEEGPYEALDMTDKQSIVCPPSDMIEADESSPRVDTRLEYVHGIRISDCRQNIRYNSDGSLVFISVTVGIVFSRVEQTQLVYRGHNKALISFDVDKAGSLACSGEQGSDPEVHVWDARTAGAIMQFKGIHRRGVGSVAFSASGEYLVTMGMDMMHSIVVLRSPSKRWADGYVQCSASVSRRRMLWCTFSENNEYPIAVGGSRAMYFFKFKGRNIEREKGTFGRRKKIQPLLCAAVTQYDVNGAVLDSVITGTVTGHIYVWNDKRIAKTAFGHDSAITSIAGISKGNFATGCKDGFVKIWNANLEQLKSFQVPLFTPQPESFAVHALRANSVGSRMTVGMRSGELYEISLSTKTYSQLFDGHSRNRLRGLAANPADGDQYASCGDDGVVRVWSIATRKCLRSTNLECACRCLAYSPDGRRLVVGIGGDATQATKDGAFFILEAASLETVQEDRKAKFCIESIKYSPMTGVIAMASMDGKVFIHDALTYALKRTLFPKARKCTMGVVDFSEDGTALRYAPNHEELFYYDVGSGEAITTTSMTRDILWDTYSCPYTWTTQGITRPAAEGALITSTALNALKTLVAVSYTDGTVRIYRYPCLTQTSGYVEVTGLASFASELDFSVDGKYLVVLDTLTRSVMQYVMVYTHE